VEAAAAAAVAAMKNYSPSNAVLTSVILKPQRTHLQFRALLQRGGGCGSSNDNGITDGCVMLLPACLPFLFFTPQV